MIPNPLVLKRDPADEVTEKLIWRAKTKAWFAYDQAKSEIEGKLSEYMDRFAKQDEEMQRRVSSGKMTKDDYIDWRKSHLMTGRRWEEMKRTIAKDLENADLIARSSIVGHMPEAYAENFNFGTYQVERSGQCDTDFTLYDRYTVEKLIESDPDLLPPPGKRTLRDIASGKLQKWQEGQIQSVTLQSILQGESVYGMARRISNELSTRGYKDCVRYARTALTGAENAGRYDSYRRAKKLGIDLTLEWMATLDGRTRHDHRLLDGQRRNVDEPFEVDGIKIFYPAQLPGESSVPQEMIWNCRCTIVAWVKGFEEDTVTSSPKMGGMSYEEWKNEKVQPPPEPKMKIDPNTGELLNPQDFPDKTLSQKVDEARVKLAQAKTQTEIEEAYKEAGTAIAEEYAKWDIEEKAKLEAWKKEYGELTQEFEELDNNLFEMMIRNASKEEQEALSEKLDAINNRKNELRWNMAHHDTVDGRADWLKNKLGEVRKMGFDPSVTEEQIKDHFCNGRSPMIKTVRKAYDHYPTEWIDKSMARNQIRVGTANRGYHSDGTRGMTMTGQLFYTPSDVVISGSLDSDHSYGTAIHELGHHFECVLPEITDAEREFYKRRTEGLDLEWLGGGYRRDEKTRRDDFLSPYMGKDYGGYAYELVSMGFQYAYTEPALLAKDPDMQAWIYGLLALR